jgi:hypothetical protein
MWRYFGLALIRDLQRLRERHLQSPSDHLPKDQDLLAKIPL